MLLRAIAEAAEEAPEQPAVPRQRRSRRRSLRQFPADGLPVVSPRDGIRNLCLIECLRTWDLRDEADQITIEQHLSRQGRRAFVTPDRLTPFAEHHTDSVDINPRVFQMRVNTTVSECVGDAPGTVLVHAANLSLLPATPPASGLCGRNREGSAKRLKDVKLNAGFCYLAFTSTAAGLLASAIAGCGSAVTHVPPAAPASASRPTTTAGFAGYKWTVVSIGHGGNTTPIPTKYWIYLQFTPNGQFGANEPVNFRSGRYEVTPGGFTTSELASTLAGWSGSDPVVMLAIDAISAFDDGTRALTRIGGDTLTVTVNGYTLIAQRDGAQANWPAPKRT